MSDKVENAHSLVPKSVIETVETFIRRMHDGDLIVTREAADIEYSSPGPSLGTTSLADDLAFTISRYEHFYQLAKDTELGRLFADAALALIERAYSNGVIREGPRLLNKLSECQKKKMDLEAENVKLLSDIEKLSSQVLLQQGRLDQLQKERRMITRVREEG